MTILPPTLIAFDVDSTLIYGPEAVQFYRQYSTALELAFATCANISFIESQNRLNACRAANDGRGELAFAQYGYSIDNVYDAICSVSPQNLPKMNQTVAVLKFLQQKATLIAITDGPDLQVQRLFAATGIDSSIFTEIISWQRGKPMPKYGRSDVFATLANRYDIDPNRILMVGDTLSVDIIPARAAGINAIHIGASPDSIPNITYLTSLYDNA